MNEVTSSVMKLCTLYGIHGAAQNQEHAAHFVRALFGSSAAYSPYQHRPTPSASAAPALASFAASGGPPPACEASSCLTALHTGILKGGAAHRAARPLSAPTPADLGAASHPEALHAIHPACAARSEVDIDPSAAAAAGESTPGGPLVLPPDAPPAAFQGLPVEDGFIQVPLAPADTIRAFDP